MLKQSLKVNVSAVTVAILQVEWAQLWLELSYLKMKLKISLKTVCLAECQLDLLQTKHLDAMADYILSLK